MSELAPPETDWPRWNRVALALFVVGQVPVAAAGLEGLLLVGAELLLLVPLLATVVGTPDYRAALPGFGLGGILLGLGLAGAVAWFGPTWQVAGAVLVSGGVLVYGLHRYELVVLELVTAREDTQ